MSTALAYRWITKRRGICGGEPVVKGTRVPVRALVSCYKQGMEFDEILRGFPVLSPAQLHEAFAYYYENQEEIEELLRPCAAQEVAAEHGLKVDSRGYFRSEA